MWREKCKQSIVHEEQLEEKEQRIRELQRQLCLRPPLSAHSIGSTTALPQTPVRETVDVMVDDMPTSARSMMSHSVDVRQPGT